jgi:hypothetical protein
LRIPGAFRLDLGRVLGRVLAEELGGMPPQTPAKFIWKDECERVIAGSSLCQRLFGFVEDAFGF